ncbi:ATPase [Streptomyces sp. N2-109]|uniref:ATPase n=1 Tax=Streptomyces gossypii TaxID=2883101 RepID=A0ABT2JUP9_9ACTN|nr:BadF/BadG/BcrA/BcrD ATPase family protein [Streptomyces gossypii]MCT2591393.1 ATPase [Streptomyces gossypii]
MTHDWVMGVDSGGSGLRTALARVSADGLPETVGRRASREPVRTGGSGIDAGHLLEQLLPAAHGLLADAAGGAGTGAGTAADAAADAPGNARIAAVCVGAAGMATLGEELRAVLPTALRESLGVRRLALAADAVTAYAGALGERPGVVVAAGTGMIALGTDLRSWRRVDGWGHLLGDCGSGAWIGRAGLEAALRAHDGRTGGSAALLRRAERLLGPAGGLPGALYPRTDRAAVLASFAPEVARCAVDGADGPPDPVAADILRRAAAEIASSAAAACPPADAAGQGDQAPAVALTGGLFRTGEALLGPLREEFAAQLPHARAAVPAGDPLDGALLIAARLAAGSLRLPADPALLSLS